MVYKEKSYHSTLNNSGSTAELRDVIENNTNKDKIIILKSISHNLFQYNNGIYSEISAICSLTYYNSNSEVKEYLYYSNWTNPYTYLNRRVTLKQGEKIEFFFGPGTGSYRYSRADLIYSLIEDL